MLSVAAPSLAGEALLLDLLRQRAGAELPPQLTAELAANGRQLAHQTQRELQDTLAELEAEIAAAGNPLGNALGADSSSGRLDNEALQSRGKGVVSGSDAAVDAEDFAALLQQRHELQQQLQFVQQLLLAAPPLPPSPAAAVRGSSAAGSGLKPQRAQGGGGSGFRPAAVGKASGKPDPSVPITSSSDGGRLFYGVPETFSCQAVELCVSAGDAATVLWALGANGQQVRVCRQGTRLQRGRGGGGSYPAAELCCGECTANTIPTPHPTRIARVHCHFKRCRHSTNMLLWYDYMHIAGTGVQRQIPVLYHCSCSKL